MQTRCYGHKDRDTFPKACPTCRRIAVENELVALYVDALLAAGFALQIAEDGDGRPFLPTTDRAAIFAALGETDDDQVDIFTSAPSIPRAFVRFVYGNDGWDVLSDYSMSLEAVLAPVNAYADTLAPRALVKPNRNPQTLYRSKRTMARRASIGTVRPEEAKVFDSHAGYHQFHAEETQEPFGSFEVFWIGERIGSPGWYWQPCFPGCLPDGEAVGPYASSRAAHEAADEWSPEYDEAASGGHGAAGEA